MKTLDSALRYAKEGFAVVPLHATIDGRCSCGNAECASRGKHPRTRHGLKDASRDPSIIRGWWARWPDANIGLVLDAEHVAVDLDRKQGKDGIAELDELMALHGPLPETLAAETPTGGRHLLFRKPADVKVPNRSNILPGIDARSAGGYIVAYPSRIDGRPYRWLNWPMYESPQIAECPDWLLAILAGKHEEAETAPAPIPEVPDPYARRALESAISRVALAAEGQRNDTLNREAHGLARLAAAGRLSWPDAEHGLLRAALAAGLPEREALATIRSAATAGSRAPNVEGTPLVRAAGEPTVEEADYHRNAPIPDDAMLYGVAGDVARAAAATTEANPYAVAMAFLTFLSSACGRDVYLPIGNTKHHARLFSLHVGRSSRGRKGDALSLVRRIQDAIEQRWRTENPVAAALGFFCGQSHSGGLSTREGLALLIHDGFKSGKEEVPPIHDKRLWVVETEFANVLHQSKRDGNTLSAALRDCWDGMSIRPATKTSRVWATNPHLALAAAITPSELRELIEARELTNGFLNRFIVFWAERDKLVTFPTPTPDAVVEELATRTMDVIRFAKGGYPDVFDTRPMNLSPEAERRYDVFYRQIGRERLPERLAAILERRPPIVLRLAMLFALSDLQHVIEERHIEAAIAWARYHAESVRFIFQDAAGEEAAQEADDAASKILGFLQERGSATRTEIVGKCFAGHLSARRIDEAIDLLLAESPPKIVVEEGERLANGKRQKRYSINRREVGEFGEVAHLVRLSASSHACEVGEVGFSPAIQVRQVRQVRNESESAEARMVEPSSPNSPNSHALNDCALGDDAPIVEVTI